MHRAVCVVEKEDAATLLVDPMRRTILNMLADEAHTESQIAEIVGLTDTAVGHHLRALQRARLIKIVKREEEAHGIMQKFYRSVALCVVVDVERMSRAVSKYFFPIHMERLRGALAALELRGGSPIEIGTRHLEELAERMAIYLAREAKKYGDAKVAFDREQITIELYSKALQATIQGNDELPRVEKP